MPLREREMDLTTPSAVPVGQTYLENRRTGEKRGGSTVYATLSTGIYRKTVDEIHEGPPYQTGGPFFSVTQNFPTQVGGSASIDYGQAFPSNAKPGDNWRQKYTGATWLSVIPILPSLPAEPAGLDDHGTSLNPDVSNLGARAYNRLRPKAEKLGLFQTIVESRDVPRMMKTTAEGFHNLWRSRGGTTRAQIRQAPKDLADHFLNAQFGWRPFVKDLTDLVSLVSQYSQHVKRMKAQNGRWVRRAFSEEPTSSSTVVLQRTHSYSDVSAVSYVGPAYGWSNGARSGITVYRQSMSRQWYVGRFRVWMGEFEDDGRPDAYLKKLRQALTLGGANVSPSLIYQVTPWSWLIDWFVNVGDNIRAFEDGFSDRVASSYMYLMREAYERYEYNAWRSGSSGTVTATDFRSVGVKTRRPAGSNFGFTLAGPLSPVQNLVLAALGVNRARF